MREFDVVIVGGGPAGLAAALEAAAAKVEVLLIDESQELGGQYYKQVPGSFGITELKAEDGQYREGAATIEQIKAKGVETMLSTLVWCIFEERTLAIYREAKIEQIRGKVIILAPGAQEVPVAFPGWTLPGVMLGGAAQALLIRQRILPGRRVVMAGVGPLQLKVASQLLDSGAEVVDILDASNDPLFSLQNALRSFGHWHKMREGLEYWLKLKKAGIPYQHRHVPVRALGKHELEGVVVAQVDENWAVVTGTERIVRADTLCLSYGFLPSHELPRLAGCKMAFDPEAGGWVTEHGDYQETNVQGVFVAGEIAGIGGADVAKEEGRLAAMGAVRALGKWSALADSAEEDCLKRLKHARNFAHVMRQMLRLKPALFKLITEDTIVCRCEEVRAKEIKNAIADGDSTLRGVKIRTRAGMGQCQGRICAFLISHLIAQEPGALMEHISLDHPRPPVKPIPLCALAADDHW